MKIVTASEMRAIDRATSERFGVPSLTLMENAGAAVADHVFTFHSDARRIVVFCGKGNNGGDGFVAARILYERSPHEKILFEKTMPEKALPEKKKSVQVILLADPAELKGDAATMYGKLPFAATIVRTSEELKSDRIKPALEADLYLDAILGTGFKPPVTGLYADAIEIMNAAKRTVIAVDIPSGADADATAPQQGSIARANAIVTFTAPRPAHLFSALTQGTTCVAPIGSPEEAITSTTQLHVITPHDFAALIAPRRADSNKGLYGHVLVIGGSLGKAGSVAMAGIAALRAGAGLSTVATPKSALATVAGFHAEVMTEPLAETDAGTISPDASSQVKELTKGKSVLAIGPGISRQVETSAFVRSLVKDSEVPIVLDADGLNAFEHRAAELSGRNRLLVITPHPGEMARLTDRSVADVQKDRLNVARTFARDHDLIVVLKGYRTLVVHPNGEAWVNTTGNPGMSTGGTGDILTGMVAAMLAQAHAKNSDEAMLAVCAAVYLHGLAGDAARDHVGEHSLVATDLLPGLSSAFSRAQRAAGEKVVYWSG
jgi:ADP-dependent NAD(P)H-hydrate dehydratase / NAD(P)H-hydrate epimerase